MRQTQREIEVKLAVADVRVAKRKIAALRAREVGRVYEMNTLYDTPKDTLRKRGHLLRLREIRQGSERWGVLTHKGPSIKGAQPGAPRIRSGQVAAPRVLYKERVESEALVESPRRQERSLRAMGLRPVFRYEKRRTSYRLPRGEKWAGRLLIELDETPAGNFWELEGPRRAIDRAARLLGYSRADYITMSYSAVWSEYSRRNGIPWGDMLFKRARRSGKPRTSGKRTLRPRP